MDWNEQVLSGFGRSTSSVAKVCDPHHESDVPILVTESRLDTLVARGAGLSYGDAAQNAGGRVVRTTQLATIHSFDPTNGEVVVGPGVTFGQLLREFAISGWLPPVTPGTQFATIGGAVANDVHGKNHDADGSFGDHVAWVDLILPTGECRRISPTSDAALFEATIGGIGLTGILIRICFRMRRALGNRVLLEERRVHNIYDYLDRLEEVRSRYRYTVGWIDGIAGGQSMGRGILEAANEIEGTVAMPPRRRVRVPIDLPARSINSTTVRMFNAFYYHRIPAHGRRREVDIESFFYPLDVLLDWNRMYGKPGFFQFQCVVPDIESRRALPSLLTRISSSGTASFLAVIKTLGRSGIGHLSFAKPGITLALDLQSRPGINTLLADLHDLTLSHGGRVYLAKDSQLNPQQFAQMYPRLREFRSILARIDPDRRMRSDMSSRLQV